MKTNWPRKGKGGGGGGDFLIENCRLPSPNTRPNATRFSHKAKRKKNFKKIPLGQNPMFIFSTSSSFLLSANGPISFPCSFPPSLSFFLSTQSLSRAGQSSRPIWSREERKRIRNRHRRAIEGIKQWGRRKRKTLSLAASAHSATFFKGAPPDSKTVFPVLSSVFFFFLLSGNDGWQNIDETGVPWRSNCHPLFSFLFLPFNREREVTFLFGLFRRKSRKDFRKINFPFHPLRVAIINSAFLRLFLQGSKKVSRVSFRIHSLTFSPFLKKQ